MRTVSGGIRAVLLFLACILAVMLVRSVWTYPVNHWDALWKYDYAAQVEQRGALAPLATNHHSARWALVVPQAGVMRLMGDRHSSFYVLPLLLFALLMVSALWGAWRWLDPPGRVLLAVLMFCMPFGFRSSVELESTVFGSTFVLLGALALARWGGRWWPGVALAAVPFFLAYGSHVTYLAFALGAGAWLLLQRRQVLQGAVFAAVLAALFLGETLVFNRISGDELSAGRLEVLWSRGHVAKVEALLQSPEGGLTYELDSPLEILERWWHLPPYEALLCLLLAISLVLLFLRSRRGSPLPPLAVVLAWCVVTFALAVTLPIRSLDPLTLLLADRARFLAPLFPLAAVIVCLALSPGRAPARPKAGPVARARPALILGLALLATHPLFFPDAWRDNPPRWKYSMRPEAFLWSADPAYAALVAQFRNGEFILVGRYRHRNLKVLRYRDRRPVMRIDGAIRARHARVRDGARCAWLLGTVPLEANLRPCESGPPRQDAEDEPPFTP